MMQRTMVSIAAKQTIDSANERSRNLLNMSAAPNTQSEAQLFPAKVSAFEIIVEPGNIPEAMNSPATHAANIAQTPKKTSKISLTLDGASLGT